MSNHPKDKTTTHDGSDAICTYGGSFENDEIMPIYSDKEFNRGFNYLDALLDVAQARKTGESEVIHKGEIRSMQDARRHTTLLKKEFRKTVAEETPSTDPQPDNKRIYCRGKNILRSMLDTAYTIPDRER